MVVFCLNECSGNIYRTEPWLDHLKLFNTNGRDSFTFYPLPHFWKWNLLGKEVVIHGLFFVKDIPFFLYWKTSLAFFGKEEELILTPLIPCNCSQLWHLLNLACFKVGRVIDLWVCVCLFVFSQPLAKNIVSEVCLACELVRMCKYCTSTLAKLANWLWTSLRQKTSSITLGLFTVVTIFESVIQMCTEF